MMTDQKYALLKSLRTGDVIRLNGSLRLIRKIEWRAHKPKRGLPKTYTYDKGWFYFAIRHCSWTRRPYTLYSSVDLASMHVELIGRNVHTKHETFDHAFLTAIEQRLDAPRLLSCCDVRGMP